MTIPQTLAKLRQYDTPTICNVIELFGVRPRTDGYMDARIKACFPEMPPMVGYAATATHRTSHPPLKGGSYAGLDIQAERFAELSGPPIIVFQDLDSPAVAANFGEVMCSVYKAFGSVGLITSGAGRDLDQVRRIGFSVFTDGTICSHGYSQILSVHIPVHIGGLVIYPNDLLHGDCNGVTNIPADIADEVADASAEFVAAENILIGVVREPGVTVARMREAQAGMRQSIEALRLRVAGRQ